MYQQREYQAAGGGLSSKLEWALEHARKGFPVFPLRPNAKEPAISNWQEEATTDENKIKSLWAAHPDANIGSPLYKVGLAAVDLDEKKGKSGSAEWAALEGEHTRTETLTFRTASGGGNHLVVRGRLRTRVGIRSGVDIKGDGGYIVMPGSIIDGKAYIVERSLPIADCPEWLHTLAGEPNLSPRGDKVALLDADLPHNVERFTAYLLTLEGAPEGSRNDAAAKLVGMGANDLGVSAEVAATLAANHWNPRCRPPLDQDELEDAVTSGHRSARNSFGCDALPFPASEFFADIGSLDEPSEIVDRVANDNRPRRFHPKSEAEQDRQHPPEWLIDGVIQRDTAVLFYGDQNAFKGFIVLDLVFSAGAGKPWAGPYSPAKPLTTLYIAGEGARGVETVRRWAWKKAHSVDALPFYTISTMPGLGSPDDVDALIKDVEAAGVKPDIIVLDTLARAMTGMDENLVKDTGVFVYACDRLRRHFGAALIVIHHKGKSGPTPRGSSNLMACFDAHFLVQRQGCSLNVVVKNEKQKDEEPWGAPLHLTGEQVQLGADGESRSTSLVFKPTPRADTVLAPSLRVDEVHNTLMSLGKAAVSTKELAAAIVDAQLEADPQCADKIDESAREDLIQNEMRTLQRQAATPKGKPPGLLRQFLVPGEVSRKLRWCLPEGDCDKSRQLATH
jgi:Bifunctional DNA primase/polymerase, N-terminal/AAA domain